MSRAVELSHWPKDLVFQRGGTRRLGEFVDRLGARRAFVVCGSTVAGGEILRRIRDGLGTRCAGIYARVEAHTPLPRVVEAAEAARAAAADVIVSVGGGSATDTGKGVAMLIGTNGAYEPYRMRLENGRPAARPPLPAGVLPHVAVPTVPGSGSEILTSAGILDPATKVKMRFQDAALLPRISLLDPEIVALCGPGLTVSTGVAILARCVEAIYARDRNPVADALALHALRLAVRALPLGISRPQDVDARAECQFAGIMSTLATMNAEVSAVHALGSTIGGRYLLAHGLAHGLLMAPVMRALLPAAEGATAQLVRVLDLGDGAGAKEAATAISQLVRELGVGPRLRDLGIPAADLDDLARQASRHTVMVNVPRPVSVAELRHWLEEVW